MDAVTVPAGSPDALDILESLMGSLAGTDPATLAEEEVARRLLVLERVDAIEAAVRGRLLAAFDAQDGHVAGGQRTTRTWLVHRTRVTKGQAAEHKAVQSLARADPVLLAALAEGHVVTKSVALQVAKWTRAIPEEYWPRPRRSWSPPPGRRRPAGPGRDLRRDPLPHRPARPRRRQRPAPGPRRIVRHDLRRRRGDPRRPDP